MGLRVVLRQEDVDQVRQHASRVEVRLAESVTRAIPARILREVPAASRELPSPALSIQGGGEFVLDPREPSELRAIENLFQFEIGMPGIPQDRIGERVFVRFEHPSEPLWIRVYRSIRRLLLSRFEV
jgi:putative peptide zinc metalloprotease protein